MKKQIYIFDYSIYRKNINFKRWTALNSDYEIFFYKLNMCTDFIFSNYGTLYLSVFEFLEDRHIKKFFWALCMLYKNGGFVIDNNIIPLIGIDLFKEDKADVIISSSTEKINYCNFDTSFIGSVEENELIKRCLLWYVEKYNSNVYNSNTFDPIKCLNSVFSCDDFDKCRYKIDKSIIQIIRQKKSNLNDNLIQFTYSGVRVFNKFLENKHVEEDEIYEKNYKCCMIMHYADSDKKNSYPLYEINKQYCENNSIDMCTSSRKFFVSACSDWERFLLICQNLEKYDYVISIDPLVMFYINDQTIMDVIKDNEEYDFIFSKDKNNNYVDLGIMIIKNTPYAMEFLNKWIRKVVHKYDTEVNISSLLNDEMVQLKDKITEPELALREMQQANFMEILSHMYVYRCGYLQTFFEKKADYEPHTINFKYSSNVRLFKAVRRQYYNTYHYEFDEDKLERKNC